MEVKLVNKIVDEDSAIQFLMVENGILYDAKLVAQMVINADEKRCGLIRKVFPKEFAYAVIFANSLADETEGLLETLCLFIKTHKESVVLPINAWEYPAFRNVFDVEKPSMPKNENRNGEDVSMFAYRNGEFDENVSYAFQNHHRLCKAEIWDEICSQYFKDEYGDKYPQ